MSPGRVLRIGGSCALAVSVVVGALTAQTVVVALAAVGAIAGGLCATLGEPGAPTDGRPARRTVDRVVTAAALGMASVLAVAGLVMLTGTAALLIVAVLTAGAAWLRYRPFAPRKPPAVAAETLSDAALALAWQASHAELARTRDPEELARLSALRRGQLDEMERRDPAGFQQWLGGAAWVTGDQPRFLGG